MTKFIKLMNFDKLKDKYYHLIQIFLDRFFLEFNLKFDRLLK